LIKSVVLFFGKIEIMKKLLGILVLGLYWVNVIKIKSESPDEINMTHEFGVNIFNIFRESVLILWYREHEERDSDFSFYINLF